MLKINRFFFRLDYIRIICWILIIPMLYITIFTTAGAMYLWITLPLTVLILLGGIIKIDVPKEDVILKVITENHTNYYEEVIKKCEIPKEKAILIECFSTDKKFLKRMIGSISIYPVCRSVVCGEVDDKLYICIKDTSLQNLKANFEKIFTVYKDNPAIVTVKKYNEKKQKLCFKFIYWFREYFSIY